MDKHIQAVNLPKISAIYYALLQCGYDFYAFEKDAGLVKKVETFRVELTDFPNLFFSEAKQNTCEVYPYWPRAAMLESAAFYIDCNNMQFRNFEAYRNYIMSAGNISEAERNQSFWQWLEGFPAALKAVFDSKEFQAYLRWENEWIEQQNLVWKNDLDRIKELLDICVRSRLSPIQEVCVVLNPIKCAYSADYHIDGSRWFYCSGIFSPASVVHEFLHHIVHPFVSEYKETILKHRMPLSDIDSSYYLANDEYGKLHAFEEYIVRKLTNTAMAENFPSDISLYINQILNDLS